MIRTFTIFLAAAALMASLAGCASAPSARPEPETSAPGATIDPDRYAEVFQRAKDVLRESNFTLERVDGRAGVITTRPAPSAGFATPWVGHTRTDREAWLSFMHREQRVARVTFEPSGNVEGEGGVDDVRDHDGPIRYRVDVTVQRVHVEGRRLDATGIGMTHTSGGRGAGREIETEPRAVPHRRDAALSRELAQSIAAVGPSGAQPRQ